MLLVNGAIAVINGMIVTTCRILCCLRGGIFCDGECRCDPNEGECCVDTWYPAENPCPEGQIFARWGTDDQCCGCIPDTIYDPRVAEDVPTESVLDELCCSPCDGLLYLPYAWFSPGGSIALGSGGGNSLVNIGCRGRCCDEGECAYVFEYECTEGTWLPQDCCDVGCPAPCCGETTDGEVTCDVREQPQCGDPSIVDTSTQSCEEACRGACCIDGVLQADLSLPLEPRYSLTYAECEALGGCFVGVGTTSCDEQTLCRPPFDENCCEHVVSSAAKLTFTGPRKRRCPELDACGFEVTVTVKTAQPVYIHGGLFGAPYEACTDTTTFLLCNDEFYVTPAPCSGTLQNLDIEVCWADASGGPETLRFHCCQDTTYLLGNCACDCVTTLLYEGDGCTSNAVIQMRGDAVIESSGTGPLVLTGHVSLQAACDPAPTLTLTGTSAESNTIQGVISGTNLDVEKAGAGTWRLSANNSYSGRLRVLDGTIVVAADVNSSGNSPFGSQNGESFLPIIGSSAAGVTGTAGLLIEGDRTIDRGMSIAALGDGSSQVAVLGIRGDGDALFGGGHDITLGRGVTLQASNSGTVTFANNWVGDPVAFTIGSEGNAGVVILEGELPIATGVSIVAGTVRLQIFSDDRINPATPVTVETATFDTNGQSQSLDSLTVNGALTIDGAGSLTVTDLAGAGDVIQQAGTFTINGANTLAGTLTVNGGTTVVTQIVSGPALVTSATFTSSTLTVAFSGTPASGNQFVLLSGPTGGSYSPVLTGAGGATGTYDSATSTLTID